MTSVQRFYGTSAFLLTIALGSLFCSASVHARGGSQDESGPATTAIFMKYDGIDGKSDFKGYEDWIQLTSMQFGVGRAISGRGGRHSPKGKGKAEDKSEDKKALPEVSEPSVSEITVMKHLAPSSVAVFREAFKKNFSKVTLRVVSLAEKNSILLEYNLGNVLISGYSMSAGEHGGEESLSLNFSRIQYSAPSGGKVAYDLLESKVE